MPPIRPIDQISGKWAEVTPARAPQYEAGVRNPLADYATNTAAASGAYRDGVQAAIQRGSFQAGVRRAGTQKWQRKATDVGVGRYGPGVTAARSDYASGFEPFRATIEQTQLPPRGPRRSPQNLQRVNVMVSALAARKEQMLRGGS